VTQLDLKTVPKWRRHIRCENRLHRTPIQILNLKRIFHFGKLGNILWKWMTKSSKLTSHAFEATSVSSHFKEVLIRCEWDVCLGPYVRHRLERVRAVTAIHRNLWGQNST
jgi:hypothetical protein